MAQKMGGLFVTVDADTKKAVDNIKEVSKSARRASQDFDRMRKSMQRAGISPVARSMDKVKKSTDKARKSTKASGDEFTKTGKKAKAAGKPLANLQGAMYRLSQSFINLRYGNPLGVFAGLTQAFTQLGRSVSGLVGKAGKGPIGILVVTLAAIPVAAVAAAAGIGAVAVSLSKFGLKEAANLEMLRVQYEGLLQSASRGAAEVEYILQLGKESVVPTEGLLEANRLLLAYGVTADDTRQKLVSFFSDFGSATGLSAARLQDMAYALGQVNTQGKANQIDMRQLANAGLNLAQVYAVIAEQQNISAEAARNLTKEGKLTADILIPAVLALQENYAPAAEKARQSAQGILVNLKDIAKINIGLAFEDLLEKLKPLLKWAEEFLEAFNFEALGRSLSGVFDMISTSLTGVGTDGASAAKIISTKLAKAFTLVGGAVSSLISITRVFFNVFMVGWYRAQQVLASLIVALSQIALGVVYIADAITLDLIPALDTAAGKVEGFRDDTYEAFENSRQSATDAAATAEAAWAAAMRNAGLWSWRWANTTVEAFDYASFVFQGQKDALKEGASDSWNRGPQKITATPIPDDPTGGGGSAAKKVNEFKEALKSLTSVWQKFRSLTAKPLGSASAIESALAFGGREALYQGNADSIVSMFTNMRQAVADYYNLLIENAKGKNKEVLKAAKSDMIEGLEAQYQELYDLARKNEDLAEQLQTHQETKIAEFNASLVKEQAAYDKALAIETAYWDDQIKGAEDALDRATRAYDAANSKLQSLISERDNYLSGIRESAFSFVNSLTETNEAIAKVTELDEFGSFSSVSGDATLDFKAQLRERLAAVKQWRADIESLMARGVDRNLMDALIAGGPDGSGALASALANETDEGIAEINSIQAELSGAVSGLQSSVSAAFFDQGIAQQQAFTNQMAANVETAKAYLQSQKDLRDQALEQLRTDYEARRDELEAQIKAVQEQEDAHSVYLIEAMKANAETAAGIAAGIQDTTRKLSDKTEKDNLWKLGRQALQGLIDGMNSKRKQAIETARSIAGAIKAEMKGAFQIQSPSRVMMGYGENISEGLAIGMENGISKVDMAAARVANAAMISGEISSGAPTVKVFIGDQELKDIVDVQITDASGRDYDVAFAGRRDF